MHQKYNEYDYFIDDESYDKIAATCAAMYSYKQSRVTPPVCRHLNWRLHVKKLHRECQFHRMSSSLLVPYTGSDKKQPDNDIFNFHLPQL
jgi:hypothetical protein